ncbi:glycoside hydrolase superfamily [Xylariales sp. PMI_506]|nr:glycoside hydrolase superfamily [Xylariales sp. PMI_506]
MLKPQATATRQLTSLDGVWNFALSSKHGLEQDKPWTSKLSPKLQVPVPSSYNDIFTDRSIRDHVGWVYYQRQAVVPRIWSQERYFLRFDAATHHGRVYVNDMFLVEHIGGYTPFVTEITDVVAPGEEFSLTVAVNNELTWETIPPGRVEILENGKRKQHSQHDFFNYAGLARSVSLFSVPIQFISDIAVTTNASNGTGTVDYEISTNEPIANEKIRVSLVDEEGATVCQISGLKNRATINSVHLWQPGNAYLYHLVAEIISNQDPHLVIDTYRLPFGVRSVKVQGNQFLINDEPFYFKGFGKHEDSPVRGKGYDPAYMMHDFNLMDWMGANSFRTSHYPYAEEVLEYADRHGIVVIDETAAVGLNLGIIAGVLGLKAPPTFCPDGANEKTQAAHAQAIRELIARDKNHPSVVLWSITNEPASADPGAREYMEPLVALTRELDPTRPVCFANMGFATVDKEVITDLFDILCLNRYYGWYSESADLEQAEKMLEKDLLGWQAKHKKPIIMTEYGADTISGLHGVMDIPWSEEYQTRFLEMYHKVFDRIDSVVGEQVWNFADFHCAPTMHRVDGNKKGIFTRDRRPKSAATVLKRRWKEEGIPLHKLQYKM